MPDFTPLLTWLLPAFPSGTTVGVVPDSLSIKDSFGFSVVSVNACEVLLACDIGIKGVGPTEVLETFRQAGARKLYLFCCGWLTKSALTDTVLNVDTNLLDSCTLLPKGAVASLSIQYSLLVLDKDRVSDGRSKISFIDATDAQIQETVDLADCPKVEKDFRNVILRREPLLASFHCALQALQSAIGASHTPLGNCATLVKSPSFLRTRTESSNSVEISCISPADYALYGYTLPHGSEKKSFPRIQESQYIRGRDILLVAQSNVGKLCIIDPSFSEPDWTGTSFTWIIRPRLDPRILYLYLSSRKVQQYFAACSRGSALPALPVPQLKLLPVPDFDEKQQDEMIAAFSELDGIRSSMVALSARARQLFQSFYF